jgi:hypothetical protein
LGDGGAGVLWQPGIGVEEQHDVTRGKLGAAPKLAAPAGRAREKAGAGLPRNRLGGVGAAAVGDDDFRDLRNLP